MRLCLKIKYKIDPGAQWLNAPGFNFWNKKKDLMTKSLPPKAPILNITTMGIKFQHRNFCGYIQTTVSPGLKAGLSVLETKILSPEAGTLTIFLISLLLCAVYVPQGGDTCCHLSPSPYLKEVPHRSSPYHTPLTWAPFEGHRGCPSGFCYL